MATNSPEGVTGAGLELWNRLHDALEFTMTESQIAVELCRTVSLCELLAKELDALGPGDRRPARNQGQPHCG